MIIAIDTTLYRKTFEEGFVAIHKGFLCKIWGHGIFWQHQWAIRGSFAVKILFSTNLWKFPTIQYWDTYQLDPVLLRASCLTLAIKEFKFMSHMLSGCWYILTAHTERLPGVQLRHSVPPVQYVQRDCEGWWLSGCRDSMAEHWRLNPEVSWIWLPAPFRRLLHFCIIQLWYRYSFIHKLSILLLQFIDQAVHVAIQDRSTVACVFKNAAVLN